MKIPSKNDCYRLMCEMQMLENIVAHSLQVCRVATCLADYLKLGGIDLNRQLIQAAALLHDITKTRSFKTQENHALTGGQYLTATGYPQVGELVRQHVRLDDYSEDKHLTEVEIINYADKRVRHDRIVPMNARMQYVMERYGSQLEYKQRIQFTWEKTKALEKRIFSYLSFSPKDLIDHLPALDITGEISNYQKLCSQISSGSI